MSDTPNRSPSDSPCPPEPLPSPLMMSEEGSFAHYTLTERLPAILQRVIEENDFPEAVAGRLQSLADELPKGPIRPISDGGPDEPAWAEYVEPYLGRPWLEVPWFDGEMYFYRRILAETGYFMPGPTHNVDPYETQKFAGLKSAGRSVRALSARVNTLASEGNRNDEAEVTALVHFALWGNRMDLSMWPADGTGADHHQADVSGLEERILVNDADAVAGMLSSLRDAHIDFVVDNAGFELFSDLCLADYLLTSGIAGAVRLHLKFHPTFVSDATIDDVQRTIEILATDDEAEVRELAGRLRDSVEAGCLQLRDDLFWTSPLAFWEMPRHVRAELGEAALVFVKGDVNYRRLLGDRHWPFTVAFEDVVCYAPTTFVALRTLKSEVIVGLQPGQIDEVAGQDPDWLTQGRWGLVQMSNPPETRAT